MSLFPVDVPFSRGKNLWNGNNTDEMHETILRMWWELDKAHITQAAVPQDSGKRAAVEVLDVDGDGNYVEGDIPDIFTKLGIPGYTRADIEKLVEPLPKTQLELF